MSIAQFALPFGIGFVATNAFSFKTIFIIAAVAIAIDGVLIAFLPFPKLENAQDDSESEKEVKKEKMKIYSSKYSINMYRIYFFFNFYDMVKL